MTFDRRTFLVILAGLFGLLKTPHKSRIPRLEELKNSIRKDGLINPILVRSDLTLIDGFYRLEAYKQLGIERIECVVINDLGVDVMKIPVGKILIYHEM